jgi:hypothetical protein
MKIFIETFKHMLMKNSVKIDINHTLSWDKMMPTDVHYNRAGLRLEMVNPVIVISRLFVRSGDLTRWEI